MWALRNCTFSRHSRPEFLNNTLEQTQVRVSTRAATSASMGMMGSTWMCLSFVLSAQFGLGATIRSFIQNT